MNETINQTLLAFIRQRFGNEGPKVELYTPLFSTRAVDSLGIVELLVFIEQRYGVSLTVTLDDLMQWDTVERLAEVIASRQGAASTGKVP